MNDGVIWKRAAEVLDTDFDGQPILLHSRHWNYLQFEGSGAAIWRLLAEPKSLDMLVAELLKTFAVEPERCRQETKQLLQTLVDEEFLVSA